jgi:hypothetical protein
MGFFTPTMGLFELPDKTNEEVAITKQLADLLRQLHVTWMMQHAVSKAALRTGLTGAVAHSVYIIQLFKMTCQQNRSFVGVGAVRYVSCCQTTSACVL